MRPDCHFPELYFYFCATKSGASTSPYQLGLHRLHCTPKVHLCATAAFWQFSHEKG